MSPEAGARVALYCRVSTQEQTKSGLSMDMQERRMRAYCEAHGYVVHEVIRDEGESAKSLSRRGIERIYTLAGWSEIPRPVADESASRDARARADLLSGDRREVQAVIILKLDRLTRSVADFGRILRDFTDAEVALESVEDRLDTTSPSGELVVNIMVAVSQWERKEIGRRTKDALAQARAEGTRLGRPRAGWKGEGGKGKLVPDGQRVQIMELVRELKASGMNLQQIADELNRRAVPTGETEAAREARMRRAARAGKSISDAPKWHKTSVSRLLKAPLPVIEPMSADQ